MFQLTANAKGLLSYFTIHVAYEPVISQLQKKEKKTEGIGKVGI